MVLNLFSIFDPVSPSIFSSNWLSLLSVTLWVPVTLWASNSRVSYSFIIFLDTLVGQIGPLMKSMSGILITVSMFLLILVNNVFGLLPYIFTPTSHPVLPVTLALVGWLALFLYTLINFPQFYMAHLVPTSTPPALLPFMVLIESTSNMIRPLTLAVRLTANLVAGHLLLSILMSASAMVPWVLMPLMAVPQSLLCILELAVACIQAYVFSILMTLYYTEMSY
uniref:ATP synthase subunit a n=1 Tax=Stygobromus foliatus TaxID=1678291 RepID=A0A172QHD8_9CRUS|nr:ATP synthase F0 subunit 6 [Stygobromus foliatus]